MFFRKTLLMMFICFSALLIIAESGDYKNPAEILKAALKNKKRLSYKTVAIKEDAKQQFKIKEYFYNKANTDGSHYTRLEEHLIEGKILDIVKDDNVRILIKNAESSFEIFLGKTTKINFERKESFAQKDLPTHGESATYKLENAKINGVSCYKIIKKVEPDYAAFENYKKFLPDWYVRKNWKNLKRECKEQFPVLQIYYIDKEKFLPWKYEFYNVGAKKIYEYTYQKIELVKKMDNKLFEIPVESHVIVSSSQKGFINNLDKTMDKVFRSYTKTKAFKAAKREFKEQQEKEREEALRASRPGIIARMNSYIDANFSSISSIISTVLFWLAMGLFAFVGIYKWRKKRSY